MSEPSLTDFLLARIAEDEANAADCGCIHGGGMADTLIDRRLAGCEAKRRIVEQCAEAMTFAGDYDLDCRATLGEDTLSHLAVVYADHPDFREEWRA